MTIFPSYIVSSYFKNNKATISFKEMRSDNPFCWSGHRNGSPFHKELAGCVLQWMQQASQATKPLFITDPFCHFYGKDSRTAVFLPRSASLATWPPLTKTISKCECHYLMTLWELSGNPIRWSMKLQRYKNPQIQFRLCE